MIAPEDAKLFAAVLEQSSGFAFVAQPPSAGRFCGPRPGL